MNTTPPQSPPEEEQVRPLAPASHREDVEAGNVVGKKSRRRKTCLTCCGVSTLIIIAVILILAFTVFRVKDPTVRMEFIQINGLSALTNRNLNTNVNLTVFAGIAVKNPNHASFRFDAARSRLFYDGRAVAEAETPPGNARARRTMRLNVTVDVMVERFVGITRFAGDLIAGEVPVALSTTIKGKAKVLFVKKSATVRLSCTMSFNLTSQDIQGLDCDRKVSL